MEPAGAEPKGFVDMELCECSTQFMCEPWSWNKRVAHYYSTVCDCCRSTIEVLIEVPINPVSEY
jgi:hypothetical protein